MTILLEQRTNRYPVTVGGLPAIVFITEGNRNAPGAKIASIIFHPSDKEMSLYEIKDIHYSYNSATSDEEIIADLVHKAENP